jgi:hypothetical protein
MYRITSSGGAEAPPDAKYIGMNRASFFCLALLLPACGLAQGEGFNLRLHLDFPATIFTSIAANDSCYYVTGLVADSVPPYRDAALFVKFDLQGHPVIIKSLRDVAVDYAPWIPYTQALRDGGLLAAGNGRNVAPNVFLVWYNDQGDTILYREYTNPGFFIKSIGLATREEGGHEAHYLLTEEVEDSSSNDSDAVLRKISHDGALLWKKRYFSNDLNERPKSIALKDDGSCIMGTWRTNRGGGSQPAHLIFARDYIIGVDSSGVLLWEYLSPASEYRLGATAMAPGPDGSLIVASGRGQRLEVSPGYYVLEWGIGLIYQLNAEREIAWEVEFTEPQPSFFFNRFHKLIELSDGSGYVAGGDFREPETFDLHGWLVKVSPEGEKLWDRKLRYFPPGDPFYEHTIYDLKEAPGGGFVLAGLARHFGAGWQGQQGWLMKVDEHGCLVPGCQLVSTREAGAPPAPALHLYPNPASEALYVLLKDERIAQRQGAQLRLLDLQGRPLRTWPAGPIDEVTSVLPLQGLPAGVYVLQYVADGQVLGAERVVVR